MESKEKKQNIAQKVLLITLYFFICLIIIFSIMAIRNNGKEGFDKCIEWKCEEKGEAFCNKYREVNNCCLGSGGEIVATNQGYGCNFS